MADSNLIMQSVVEFQMNVTGRMAPVSKWIGALMQLFQSEIKELLVKRDQEIARLAVNLGNRENVLNSREHHVLSECKIDLMGRLSENLLAVNS